MERADISKLWHLEEIAAAGHHDLAANLRTAINELVRRRVHANDDAPEIRALTGRTVSCEACNGMAKEMSRMKATIVEAHSVDYGVGPGHCSCEWCE